MKKGVHPKYEFVVFKDQGTGSSFLTRSTKSSGEKVQWEDGQEYPLIEVEISSASHPFFTGTQRMVDTAGRIEKFKKRYGKTD